MDRERRQRCHKFRRQINGFWLVGDVIKIETRHNGFRWLGDVIKIPTLSDVDETDHPWRHIAQIAENARMLASQNDKNKLN